MCVREGSVTVRSTSNGMGGAIGEAEWRTRVFSCGISSRASNQTARPGLALSDSLSISRLLRPFKRGDFQLMSHLQSLRQESLGVVPSKSVSGTVTRNVGNMGRDSERYSRRGAGEVSPRSVLRSSKNSAITLRWHMWETWVWSSCWNALNRAPSQRNKGTLAFKYKGAILARERSSVAPAGLTVVKSM